jgi:cytochrome c6
MKFSRVTAALAVLAVAASVAAARSTAETRKSSTTKKAGTTASDKTADLYTSKCASCHAADGAGTAMGKKLGAKSFKDEADVKATDTDLAKDIKEGKNKMPAFKTLTDDQVTALVKHIRTIQGKTEAKGKTTGKKGSGKTKKSTKTTKTLKPQE